MGLKKSHRDLCEALGNSLHQSEQRSGGTSHPATGGRALRYLRVDEAMLQALSQPCL